MFKSLVQLDLRELHSHQGIQVSQSRHGKGSLVVLDKVLLVPTLALALYLHLLLVFLSYLLI
jgi:hypothetical protein